MRLPPPFLVGVVLPPISHARDLISQTTTAMFLSALIIQQENEHR
jgi:hypothetical protein